MTNGSAARARRPRADASERILRATAHTIVERGAVDLALHDVADEAGVSKGLIHYHYHDKETLLARLVEWITRNAIGREGMALAESTPRSAIDDMWRWLEGELERGHLRVLVELAEWRGELVRREIAVSVRMRREAALQSTSRLYELLGLRPRVPVELITDVVLSFRDGLAIAAAGGHEEGVPRALFDVFWLAMLGLAD
jgi:AcrR family transcriptional regulator